MMSRLKVLICMVFLLMGSASVMAQKPLAKPILQKSISKKSSPKKVKKTKSPVVQKNMKTGYVDGYQWVDLGLSVKWGTHNLYAKTPEDFGWYFSWGNTAIQNSFYEESCPTYNKSLGNISGLTKYDVVASRISHGWRLPTQAEFEELISKCKWQWVENKSKSGYLVTGKNGMSIFLPTAGYGINKARYCAGTEGYYWTSMPVSNDTKNAHSLLINSHKYEIKSTDRSLGLSVRPVLK